jgi:nanoRNase/pAp phosphatase (c-di-AMP/oligoRNAs hydrolase)
VPESGPPISSIAALVKELQAEEYVFIQPHNFPDHDAVASALGLQWLFSRQGVASRIVYDGDIQRSSLQRVIDDLEIEMIHTRDAGMDPAHKVIVVDGCKGNANVTDLIGDEIAVIDHHQVDSPEDVRFVDIRPEYGACATIVGSYLIDAGMPIPPKLATAIMIAISVDTALLTRGVSEHDLRLYFHCFDVADMHYVNSVIRNHIHLGDLELYRYVIDHLEVRDRLAFCHFRDGCSQNLLGIIADFVLALEEIDLVVLSARNGDKVNLSVRSEEPSWDASRIVRTTLAGRGFGGGHADMAGGVITDAGSFVAEQLHDDVDNLLIR